MKFTAYKLTLTIVSDGGSTTTTSHKMLAEKPTSEIIRNFISEEIAEMVHMSYFDIECNIDDITSVHLDIDEREFDFPEGEAV